MLSDDNNVVFDLYQVARNCFFFRTHILLWTSSEDPTQLLKSSLKYKFGPKCENCGFELHKKNLLRSIYFIHKTIIWHSVLLTIHFILLKQSSFQNAFIRIAKNEHKSVHCENEYRCISIN